MSELGFGFLRLPRGEGDYDWDTLCAMTDRFLSGGGRYFDTCWTYLNGASEKGIRDCLVRRHPRESFLLADKLPGYLCRSRADCRKYFDQSRERCETDWFDVYMLHWLNRENYAAAEALDEFAFLDRVKEAGLAKRIGFSYHDSASLLDEILTAHPQVDLVQLQINYLDWDAAGIEAGKCYRVCEKHGKKIVVMEPVKGGTLASLPREAEALLRSRHPDWSCARWALQFVRSLPQVEVYLSGMSAPAQVEDNLCVTDGFTGEDLACLQQVVSVIEAATAVGCTGCGYCLEHCPQHIPIPSYFRMFNELRRTPQEGWKIRPTYESLARETCRASECLQCGACQQHCPQHLPIPQHMRSVAEALG